MNSKPGYISSALIRPLIDGADPALFESLPAPEFEEVQEALKQLRDPNNRISDKTAHQLISLIIRHSNDESLCVQSYQRFNPKSSAQLQHLFLCCNSLREALYYFEKFASLLSHDLDVQITKTREDIIKIKFPVSDTPFISTERHRTEIIISTILSWLKQLCGSHLEISNITLPFPATQYMASYKQKWDSEVEFNAEECTIQFHQKWLDEGLHSTNPHILNMMKREVEEQYRKLSRSGSLANRIEKVFSQRKVRLNANQQEVADYFHISARTLNRHLSQEGTSLKQIVTKIRLEIARDMLIHTTQSIEQIAIHLGLSGRRTLDRIFIKEMNMSPAQYRINMSSKADQPNVVRLDNVKVKFG